MVFAVLIAWTLSALPATRDEALPADGLSGLSSTRLARPVVLRFDAALTDAVTPLKQRDSGETAGLSEMPLDAIARFAPGVARRHFEEAGWASGAAGKAPRSLVVKSVSVVWSPGPHYEVRVVVDRFEGARRLGQATGTGHGMGERTAQRQGAAFAGPFGLAVMNDANRPKPEDDGATIQKATLAALDSALYQLAAVWSAEQSVADLRKSLKK